MDMSKFTVELAHPVDIPSNPYKNLGMDKEIKALEKSIKDAERKLYDGKPDVDEEQLKKNRERLEYLEKIKELKKRKSEAEKKTKQAEKDGEEVSEDTIILEYEKEELKKLEEESHKKPKPECMLSGMERATWQMFLPDSYSNASLKLSDFLHKLPGDLLREWSDLKSVSAFKDYEIRASAPYTHPQYFALFGFRDNAECWLIAHWHGSQTCEPFDIAEIEDQCIEKIRELSYRKGATWVMAILSLLVGIPSVLALTSHWIAGGIGTGIAVLLFALSMSWRQELDTTFSPREEADLLSYLQDRRTARETAPTT